MRDLEILIIHQDCSQYYGELLSIEEIGEAIEELFDLNNIKIAGSLIKWGFLFCVIAVFENKYGKNI